MKTRLDGEGALFQTKDGRWIARTTYWVDGKRKYVSGTGHTRQQALKRQQQNQAKLLTSQTTRRTTSPKTSEELLKWASYSHQKGISAGVISRQQKNITRQIVERYNDPPIEKLTTELLENLFNEELADATPSQRRNAYKHISPFLNWLVATKQLPYNPLASIPTPKVAKSSQLEYENRNIEFLTNLIRGLLKRLKTVEPDDELYPFKDIYLPIKLQMTLGLRTGEVLGLETSCLSNLNRGRKTPTLTIKQQLAWGEGSEKHLGQHIRPTTKSGKERVIPLPKELAAELSQHLKTRPTISGPFQDLLFLNPKTKQPYHTKKWANQHLNAAVKVYMADNPRPGGKNAEIPLRAHTLRHIAASLYFEAGIPLETVKEILGHQSEAMTQHYTHVGTQQKLKATEAIAKL